MDMGGLVVNRVIGGCDGGACVRSTTPADHVSGENRRRGARRVRLRVGHEGRPELAVPELRDEAVVAVCVGQVMDGVRFLEMLDRCEVEDPTIKKNNMKE